MIDAAGRKAEPVLDSASAAEVKRRVLVVEDEAIVSLFLVDLLEELKYSVCGTAPSGEVALQLAAIHKPDVALVDVGLAGHMDGVATAIALRERFDIPAIFLSGIVDPALLERSKLARPVGLLSKPCMPADVAAMLNRAFGMIRP